MQGVGVPAPPTPPSKPALARVRQVGRKRGDDSDTGERAAARGPLIDRRAVLRAGALAGLTGTLAACSSGPETVRRALRTPPASAELEAVEHVVFLMQENRSFDHYFGSYPGVRGFDDHLPGDPGVFAQPWPGSRLPPAGRLLPFHLDTATSQAECTADLSHTWQAQHLCWNGGAMNGFVRTHTSPRFEGPVNGVLTMGYYTRADLAFYYALADAFTICDGYHCSVLGPTDPNRLYSLSGTIDPAGKQGGPVVATNLDASYRWTLSWETMPERLSEAGISWRVYNPPGAIYDPANSLSMLVSNNRLMYFSQYEKESSLLHKEAFSHDLSDFARDVADDRLPAVSWLVAPVVPADMSEHPPAPPSRGEYFSDHVLKVLSSNEKLWAKTVLFISWDENDGFFDHVAPPVPPAGTRGEYLDGVLPPEAAGIRGPIGLGFRVPMLVVSPFSRGGAIFSGLSDHTSQLRFLESRFGVAVPNLSRWRRETVGDLTGALHLRRPAPGLPPLPATSLHARVLAECTASELEELSPPSFPDLVPRSQAMPRQEK